MAVLHAKERKGSLGLAHQAGIQNHRQRPDSRTASAHGKAVAAGHVREFNSLTHHSTPVSTATPLGWSFLSINTSMGTDEDSQELSESTVFLAQDLYTREFVTIPIWVFWRIFKKNDIKDYHGNDAYTLNCGWVDLERNKVFQRFVESNSMVEKKFRAAVGALVTGEL